MKKLSIFIVLLLTILLSGCAEDTIVELVVVNPSIGDKVNISNSQDIEKYFTLIDKGVTADPKADALSFGTRIEVFEKFEKTKKTSYKEIWFNEDYSKSVIQYEYETTEQNVLLVKLEGENARELSKLLGLK